LRTLALFSGFAVNQTIWAGETGESLVVNVSGRLALGAGAKFVFEVVIGANTYLGLFGESSVLAAAFASFLCIVPECVIGTCVAILSIKKRLFYRT
jgi:hypothetical protein